MSIYYVTFIQAREIGIINYYREEKERNELKYRNLIPARNWVPPER